MKTFLAALRLLAFTSLAAQASVIFDFTDSLNAGDPTQVGRLSRTGTAQDWSGGEAFPGVINTSTTYHYATWTVNAGNTPFLQLDVDSLSANTFVSAYQGSYAPNSAGTPNLGFDTNWLGDEGFSGNSFGTDPAFFQIAVAAFSDVVIVVNQTSPVAGLGDPFHITVEGFIDTQFTDAAVAETPEPSALSLCGGGLLLFSLAGFARRKETAGISLS